MPDFYVNKNKQTNGDNEVHRSDEVGCQNPALSVNRVDLGWHSDCQGAVLSVVRVFGSRGRLI